MKRIDLLHGTLDTLKCARQHGHGTGQAVRASSQTAFQVEHGTVYAALRRLERRGWLAAEWKSSEGNRRTRC